MWGQSRTGSSKAHFICGLNLAEREVNKKKLFNVTFLMLCVVSPAHARLGWGSATFPVGLVHQLLPSVFNSVIFRVDFNCSSGVTLGNFTRVGFVWVGCVVPRGSALFGKLSPLHDHVCISC